MVSFILNGNEITSWMGYSFKSKSTKSRAKQHFSLKRTSFLLSSCKLLDSYKDTEDERQLNKTAIFIDTPMKKAYLAIHFIKGCFCQFLDIKVLSLMPKYYLLAGETSQGSIFFLT